MKDSDITTLTIKKDTHKLLYEMQFKATQNEGHKVSMDSLLRRLIKFFKETKI